MNLSFSNSIITWYRVHKRELPWRESKDPYKIWLSEIILQQTRVAQGLPYYNNFIKKYPTIQSLAEATEQEVLKLWQGLGYYSRARNLHFTAKYIVKELMGEFPNSYNELIMLKGVGDYTAAAITSFCFNEVKPCIDGNVYRVLSRFFGIETPIDSSPAKKEFGQLANLLIDKKNPALFNQAIMEFGALQCVPKNPKCALCPIENACYAKENNKVNVLPLKNKRIKIRKRFFNFIVIRTDDNKTLIQKRLGKGIWENLYQFPLVETDNKIDINSLLRDKKFIELTTENDFTLKLINQKTDIHKLSHQHLYINFWLLRTELWGADAIAWNTIHRYPFPVIIQKIINKLQE